MEFIITNNTGYIEDDIITTILNFNDEEMSKFLKEIRLEQFGGSIRGRTAYFRYPSYDIDLYLKNPPKDIEKQYNDNPKFYWLSLRGLLKILKEYKNSEYQEDVEIANIISSKINTKEIFINAYTDHIYNNNFYNNCFAILSSEEMFNKFLDYENNNELFGSNFTKEDYVLALSKILGSPTNEMDFRKPIYDYEFVNYKMLDRYSRLRNIVNIDIKLLGNEPFGIEGESAYYKQIQDLIDNDWQVNPKLLNYVMEGISQDTDLLEKVAHIYIKLCYALRYSNKYSIFEYGTSYRKERQEAISLLNNEVICSEFSKLCTNILNKLDKSLEARCISADGQRHESFGILIQDRNIRIDFEAVDVKNYFNDFGRVKLGLPLEGINYICDRNDDFKDAVDKVYNKFLQDKEIKTVDLIDIYDEFTSNKTIEIDTFSNIEAFLNKMKQKQINGNELLNTYQYLNHLNYFGDINYAFVAEDKKHTFEKREKMESVTEVLDGIEENILIKTKKNYYLLKLNNQEVIPMTKEEVNQLFEQDKMDYINENYQLEGIGRKR